ncbi:MULTISPECIES: hypothetical protein [Asaia]|uniref:Uncharacterized protein n=1 Tax=Asaia bogorensis TaxID=91915 RepID=A0A060QKP3_9PROT|nr:MULTISPECIES: hypothetical protein [Asaia]CDG39612.1 hypothetical protein ASAP_1567 [Asaia bogorensis]
MKLYLPNMGTIKSFTEHDAVDIRWHTEWDHVRNEPGKLWAEVGGRAHYEEDFFETAEEARNEALRRRTSRIAYLERRLAQLRELQEKAEAVSC